LILCAVALPLAGRPRAGASLAVAAMGFTGIALEILLLVAFQAIYGYVYYQLALLIAGYMAGGALGSYLALAGRAPALRTIQILAALAPLTLYASFEVLARYPVPAVFPLLALVAGALGGCQFPVAGKVFFGGAKTGPAGALYAVDLLGASLAALAVSTWLVPVFGFFRTALLTALVNVPAAWAARPGAPETPAP
jgi:spermidine synthase